MRFSVTAVGSGDGDAKEDFLADREVEGHRCDEGTCGRDEEIAVDFGGEALGDVDGLLASVLWSG